MVQRQQLQAFMYRTGTREKSHCSGLSAMGFRHIEAHDWIWLSQLNRNVYTSTALLYLCGLHVYNCLFVSCRFHITVSSTRHL